MSLVSQMHEGTNPINRLAVFEAQADAEFGGAV